MHSSHTTTEKLFERVGVFGLGVIGGSWARALKRLGAHVVATDTDARNIAAALDAGAIDGAGECFADCDLVLLCAPPTVVCEVLPRLACAGMITDVCSVKTPVMKAAEGLKNFVGGHPMAGSEQAGFSASDARLFEGAPYALCVPEHCTLPQKRIAAFENLLTAIGAKPIRMTAEAHDASVAMVSHLPHAAAFALAKVAAPEALSLAGRGFADMTRIAKSSPALWADIMLRSPQLVPALSRYIAALSELSAALSRHDTAVVESLLTMGGTR